MGEIALALGKKTDQPGSYFVEECLGDPAFQTTLDQYDADVRFRQAQEKENAPAGRQPMSLVAVGLERRMLETFIGQFGYLNLNDAYNGLAYDNGERMAHQKALSSFLSGLALKSQPLAANHS